LDHGPRLAIADGAFVALLFDLATGREVCQLNAFLLERIQRCLGMVSDGIQVLALSVIPTQVVFAAGERRKHFGGLAVGPLLLDFCAVVENYRSIGQTIAPSLDRRKLERFP